MFECVMGDVMNFDQDFIKHQLQLFTKLLNDFMDRHKKLEEDVTQLKDAYLVVSEENTNLKRQLEDSVDAVLFNSQQLKTEMEDSMKLKRTMNAMKSEIDSLRIQNEDNMMETRSLNERFQSMREDKENIETEIDALRLRNNIFEDPEEIQKKLAHLSQAVKEEDLSMVENLLEKGLSPDSKIDIAGDEEIPLIIHSVNKEQKDLLNLMITFKANLEQTDKEYETPLHYSVSKQNLQFVEILVQNNCKINCRNQFGRTPLHEAAANDDTLITQCLISKGANINLRDQDGESPIFKAIWYNKYENVQILLNCGLDVNAENYQGNTPLHIACWRGHVDIVKLLLSCGAKKSVANYHNLCANNFASNKAILKLLK